MSGNIRETSKIEWSILAIFGLFFYFIDWLKEKKDKIYKKGE